MVYENPPEIYLDTGVPRESQGNVLRTFLFSFILILLFSPSSVIEVTMSDIQTRAEVFEISMK